MLKCARDRVFVLGLVLAFTFTGHQIASAQAPVIEETGVITLNPSLSTPGSMSSLLGPMPGSSGITFGMQPGRDDMILGRAGLGAPRVPTAITTPGGVYQGPPRREGIAFPPPLAVPLVQHYGTMALPTIEYEGPANGLTLDQAIEILVKRNIELRAKYLEIPQGRADVLTASLRSNPIFYADSQLVPYGTNSVRKPTGPTQYDVNFSHPIDYSHKRRARTAYASRALQVMEAQYQNEVRLAIANLHTAFVDVLTARATIRYMEKSVEGLEEVVRVAQGQYEKRTGTRSDVDQAKSDRASAVLGVMDAQEMLQKRKRVLGELLDLSPQESERLEVRGALRYESPPLPPLEELLAIARDCRPDVAAYRLGVEAANSNVRLQLANRFSDAYLLYQPYTFQNNAPFGTQSGVSWALGITVPLPLYNRNQGNIERARINVVQSQEQLKALDRRLITEIQQSVGEYEVSARIVRSIREDVLPGLQRAKDDKFELFREGEDPKIAFLNAQRKYNDAVQNYLDSAARHRRSALDLNTVVGHRIMP
jgi:cobalt-zinc-cadmium efflux system outer membrane protein